MRVNLYLNENEPKDKVIIDFLNKRYSSPAFIKETLFGLATGEPVGIIQKDNESNPLESRLENDDEYEEISNIDEIDL